MPLVIISGYPSSGKTTRCQQLMNYFKSNHVKKSCIIVQDDFSACSKNKLYSDEIFEKAARGRLKSETLRLLNKNTIVILDSLNNIKGYRYELYCAAKSLKNTQIVLYHPLTLSSVSTSPFWYPKCGLSSPSVVCSKGQRKYIVMFLPKQLGSGILTEITSEQYEKEVFNALVMRYEEPDSRNRWDSPLFTLLQDDAFNFKAIEEALFDRKPPPPNMSTQNAPLSSTNFLYELDNMTQKVVKDIMDIQKTSLPGDEIMVNMGDGF
ncbi:Protein KTI12 [Nymphon striatum]|nr:Protein KTI12 [Nymphon striatum]